MTKGVKNDAVDEASLKAVSKYLEGRKLNIVNIPLFEKLLSMKGYSGPNRENLGEKQPKSKTSASADNTTGKVETDKKSTEAASTNKSTKSQSNKSVHVEKKCETGIVNPAFQSSDTVEDSGKSEAGGGFAIDSEVVAESELKPGASAIDRSPNETGPERRESGDAKSEHQKDCVMQEVNDEDDGNPGVEPRVENEINNNPGQDNELPLEENKSEVVGQAMKSAIHKSVEAAVAHVHGEEVSSDESDAGVGDDESNDEEQRAGPRKVSSRKAWLQNQKNALKRDGDRMRRRNSRRNIGGGRVRSAGPSTEVLDEEVVIERFQLEPEAGFLSRVFADTTGGDMQGPLLSRLNLAGPSVAAERQEQNEVLFHESDNAQVEGQAAVEGGGSRGNELQGEHSRRQVDVAQQYLQRDANERREESDNPASDDFLTGEEWQTTDGFQTADDGASESDSVGTHGDDFYDCEDAISLDENAEPTTRQGLMPTHRDLGAGGDDYDGDDSDGSVVDDRTRTTDSMHAEDTVLEQTVVETVPNTVRILHDMEVDQTPPVAVGGEGVPGPTTGHAEASNNRGESSRSAVMRLETVPEEPAEADLSPTDQQGEELVSGVESAFAALADDAAIEFNESILETRGDVAIPSDDDGDSALAVSNSMPRTSSPVACAAKADSSAERDFVDRESSEGPNSARAGNNEHAAACDAPVVKQVDVGNGPPRAPTNVVLHELENLVQVLKNYSDPSIRSAMRDFAVERSREYCLLRRKNMLLNAIAISSKKTTRVLLHMLKEHMLRIKYLVHNKQESSLPISEEVCTLVWDLPLAEFAKLETIVDTIAIIFDSPIAKIKTVSEVLKRADYELSTGMLQRQLQYELSRVQQG